MTIRERMERAAEWKNSGRYNCCQAVMLALADLTNLSEEQLLAVSSGFAAGMGNLEATCGALIGAGMAAGLCGAGRSARRMNEAFFRRAGAITCKDLKGRNSDAPLLSCEDCVRTAVLVFCETLGIQ